MSSATGPPARRHGVIDGVRAALVMARGIGVPVPTGRPVNSRRARLDDVTGRRWDTARNRDRAATGSGPAPLARGAPVLLAAGVTPQGPDDPRVARLAAALASAGSIVFVPHLALSERRLTVTDVERLVTATRALRGETGRRVTIVGFSFGGSYSLIAAADPRLNGCLRLVASFGAYGDLVSLLQAATTGVTTFAGRLVAWHAGVFGWGAGTDAMLDSDLVAAFAHRIAKGDDGMDSSPLMAALAGCLDVSSLSSTLRAGYDLLANRDPRRVRDLAGRLPERWVRLMARLSPVSVAGDVDCPVALLHAVDDPTVPFVEMHRLADALPTATGRAVRAFTHVDFVPTPGRVRAAIGDLANLWRVTCEVLDPASPAEVDPSPGHGGHPQVPRPR